MCGRITLTTDKDDLQSRFGYIDPEKTLFRPRYNVAPTQTHPIVTVKEGQRVLNIMRWGLVPFWAKDAKIGYNMINAKAETVATKPSFRTPFKKKRCLVLADGFYEWSRPDKKTKIPYRFVLKSREPFAFAGLWESWTDPKTGEELLTFTIITTGANKLMEPIHDRMPVILHEKDESMWLDSKLIDTSEIQSLLIPYPSTEMEAYKVSQFVNSAKNDKPECINPVE